MTRLIGLVGAVAIMGVALFTAQAAELPVFDAHIHYSQDAWDVVSPKEAIAILRKAGVTRALVSSSSDEGTQKLLNEAPDLVVPELRPYRARGETSSWIRDDSVIPYLEERLGKFRYVAIGEFHLSGADADLSVPRRMVQLARQHGLMLHAHSDADAVERLFRQDPGARILWAHAGFEPAAKVREMLRKYRTLWADLSFRTEVASGGKVTDEWRALFLEFPDRFMLGTDTYVPDRWNQVPQNARWAREWLADLPRDVAERIAFRNAESVLADAYAKRK